MSATEAAKKRIAASRKADLARIHVGKKALGLDDDAYRDLLWALCKVKSAGDLDFVGRQKLLTEFKRLGWNPAPKPQPGRKRWVPETEQNRKILALWLTLKNWGALENPTDEALFGFVERMTGITHPRFLTSDQANVVIEALKQWQSRMR